jgi:hypothetical protein
MSSLPSLSPFRPAVLLVASLLACLSLLPCAHAQSSTGSTGSETGSETGSGGTSMSWDTGTTDNLGGGTLTLASAIFNGGTVTNGTIVANGFTAYSGQVGAVLAGSGGLTKHTAGTTVTLSAANTYTGTTTIFNGTLRLTATGSLAGTSQITLADSGSAVLDVSAVPGFTLGSGQKLGGFGGTILGAVTLGSGSTFGLGSTYGTTTFTSGLTLASGANLNLVAGSDLIQLTGGTLTGPSGTGGITLNLANPANDFTAGTYTLFDFTTGGTTLSNFDVGDFTLGTVLRVCD